jgi:hypothetical protein
MRGMRMFRKIVCLLLAISLLSAAGCSLASKATETSATTPASVKTVREAKISKTWIVKQLEIDLNTEVPIVLKLKDGDKVDGYFYLEKGANIGFNISGSSLIYTSKPDTDTTRVASDRFSFTATQDQGIAYTLTFSANPGAKSGDTTVYLELIYPATGTLLVPIGTK